MKSHPTLTAAIASLMMAVLLAGCASSSSSKQKTEQTSASMAALRNDLVRIKRATDSTLTSLSGVVVSANSDPRKAFGDFTKSLAQLDAAVHTIKTRAQEIRAQGDAYFKLWEAELKQVEDSEIRRLAEQRKAKLKETFDKLSPLLEKAKADFEPFSSDIHDLQKYLNNDLTLGGIDAAKSLIVKTQERGRVVQGSLEALIVEMNTAAATIVPPPVIK
jgi:hypothetical protein